MLEILIPTYKRKDKLYFVIKTLQELIISYKKYDLTKLVSIRIHENNSSENLDSKIISDLSHKLIINYFLHKKNLGLIGNVLSLCRSANSRYILWHSDDDLIKPEYFYFIIEKLIENSKSKSSLVIQSKELSRIKKLTETQYSQFYKKNIISNVTQYLSKDCLSDLCIFSLRSHQLTGLVLPRESLNLYLQKQYISTNYHPFIGMTLEAIFKTSSKLIYYKNSGVLVSKDNIKDWSYTPDYFFLDIFEHFDKLDNNKLNKIYFDSIIIFTIIRYFCENYIYKPFKFLFYILPNLRLYQLLVAFYSVFYITIIYYLRIIKKKFKIFN